MAYTKRIPPIKLILNVKEYNTLIGVLTKNIENSENKENDLAVNTKEKLLKYSIPRQEQDGTEIDLRLYINEAADLISELIKYASNKTKEIDYYQVLSKVRENMLEKDNELYIRCRNI